MKKVEKWMMVWFNLGMIFVCDILGNYLHSIFINFIPIFFSLELIWAYILVRW